MPTETVRADWLHDRVFRLTDHQGYTIRMTQPDGVAGADLLPLSLIGCALWDIQAILHKQRAEVTALHATADCLRSGDPPYDFQRIDIHYVVAGRGLTPAQVSRAISLSESKYCATYATLAPAVTITSAFEIIPAASPSQPPASPANGEAAAVVAAFVAAFNARHVGGLLSLLTPDAVLEHAFPQATGARSEGRAAARAFWEQLFAQVGALHLEPEEVLACDHRCVLRYACTFREAGEPRRVQGVDVFRLRNGLIAEKLSYVKG